jgi:APA family basic amino acid/polyamine antiporter
MNSPSASLQARLGLFSTTAIVVGTMIGSGIFKKTAPMAAALGSPELIIGTWIAAGLITLCGALSVAEVTAMMPQSGGQYRFYQHMYGRAFAFVSGWAIFTVIQTGSIAAIAYVFSHYMNSVVPLVTVPQDLVNSTSLSIPVFGTVSILDSLGIKALTCGLIVLLTLVNVRGVVFGGSLSGVFTVLKVLAVVAIIACGLMATPPAAPARSVIGAIGSSGAIDALPVSVPAGLALIPAIMLAMSKAFWAYDGWGSIAYIGDEVRDAQRTLPRAIIMGVSMVIVLYVLINMAYLHALPVQRIAASSLVAADVMVQAVGAHGAMFVAVVVMISTLGAVNGTILNSARVYYAMACDGLFFSSMRKVHPRFNTPSASLYVQCLWSCLLVVTGTFETLTDMLIFVSWIFYGMSAYGVFVLRRKMPDAVRPYKVWGYPVVPLVFIAFSAVFLVITVGSEVTAYANGTQPSIPSVTGVMITLTGIPFYLMFKRRIGTSD